jgi:hypothetical protein
MKAIPCEIYTRVVGYYRPTSEANPGKRAEIADRKMADLQRIKKDLTKQKNGVMGTS